MKNGSKFSHLLTVRTDGADPPPPPPYGQPDRNISVFFMTRQFTIEIMASFRLQISQKELLLIQGISWSSLAITLDKLLQVSWHPSNLSFGQLWSGASGVADELSG